MKEAISFGTTDTIWGLSLNLTSTTDPTNRRDGRILPINRIFCFDDDLACYEQKTIIKKEQFVFKILEVIHEEVKTFSWTSTEEGNVFIWREEKAVELYIKSDKSVSAVVRELGIAKSSFQGPKNLLFVENVTILPGSEVHSRSCRITPYC